MLISVVLKIRPKGGWNN